MPSLKHAFLSVTWYWIYLPLASQPDYFEFCFPLEFGIVWFNCTVMWCLSIFSVVRQVDGTLVKRYKHPGPVYGCDWSLNNRCVSDLYTNNYKSTEITLKGHITNARANFICLLSLENDRTSTLSNHADNFSMRWVLFISDPPLTFLQESSLK